MSVSPEELTAFLRAELATRIAGDADAIGEDVDFTDLGLKSLDAVIVSGRLEDRLGIEIEPTIMFENRTIASLRAALLDHVAAAGE